MPTLEPAPFRCADEFFAPNFWMHYALFSCRRRRPICRTGEKRAHKLCQESVNALMIILNMHLCTCFCNLPGCIALAWMLRFKAFFAHLMHARSIYWTGHSVTLPICAFFLLLQTTNAAHPALFAGIFFSSKHTHGGMNAFRPMRITCERGNWIFCIIARTLRACSDHAIDRYVNATNILLL